MNQDRVVTRRRTARAKQAHTDGTRLSSPWFLVVVFFFLTSVFVFLRSPFFSVKNYVINGACRVSHAEIIARCTQKSDNIFDLDLDKMEKAIQSSPWIKQARCTRKFPDTLVIDILERKPAAFAPVGNKTWLIDEEGRVLQEDDGVFTDLIALTGVQGVLSPGQFLGPQYEWALKVIRGLGPLARNKAIEVNVEDGECSLILDDGCVVFLGGYESNSEFKLELLESILKELEQRGQLAEYIDLRFDKHAVKLRL